jgi:prostaglandin-E synthase 1
MDLLDHPAFGVYAVCAAILVFKMMVVGHVTAGIRIMRSALLNPEDFKAFRREGQGETTEHPDVARGLRAHRNDLESTLPFLAIGWVYLGLDPPADLAKGLFVVFTASRTLFSIFYFLGAQPWRSASFILGEGMVLIMLGQIVYWVAT